MLHRVTRELVVDSQADQAAFGTCGIHVKWTIIQLKHRLYMAVTNRY